MRSFKFPLVGLFALLFGLLVSCVAVDNQGRHLPDEPEEASVSERVDVQKIQVESVIASIAVDRGPKLLRDLQWLIRMKGMATPVIVASLPDSSAQVRSNLLYVLGFDPSPESAEALKSYLGDPDDATRYEAAAALLHHGDYSATPILIKFLESSNRHMRFKAVEALRETTGREFGYSFSEAASLRAEAVARWKAWWASEKRRLMRRTTPVGDEPGK